MTSAISIAIAGAGAAIGIGLVGYAWLTGLSRNPEAGKSMFTPGIIALALAEFVALLAFVIALIK